MANRIKNALDFSRASQRLFIATWVPMFLATVIVLLKSSDKTVTLGFTPFFVVSFIVLGSVSLIGSFACKKMMEVIKNRDYAVKKSNRAHRCQVLITVILFLFLAGAGLVLLVYGFMYFAQDKFGDNRIYSVFNEETQLNTTINPALMIKQEIISNIIRIIISMMVCIVYIVCYMKILITSDVARKNFSDIKIIEEKTKTTKKEYFQEDVSGNLSDDNDDSDEKDL